MDSEMPRTEKGWLSLTEASALLGVHPTTLRRWADAGNIPCLRTPGGHRRFRAAGLQAWMGRTQNSDLSASVEVVMQKALGLTRQEMVVQRIPEESWYSAFHQEGERKQLQDSGRRLFALALQYLARIRDREPILREGRRLGAFFGEQTARRGIPLVDTVRAFFFYRESLLRAARPGLLGAGQYDDEEVRIHRELRQFLDEVMYACLARYESIRYETTQPVSG